MNSLELITVTLLITLLSARVLIVAYGAGGVKKKHIRILDIVIAPLLLAFCVIVVRTVTAALGA